MPARGLSCRLELLGFAQEFCEKNYGIALPEPRIGCSKECKKKCEPLRQAVFDLPFRSNQFIKLLLAAENQSVLDREFWQLMQRKLLLTLETEGPSELRQLVAGMRMVQ